MRRGPFFASSIRFLAAAAARALVFATSAFRLFSSHASSQSSSSSARTCSGPQSTAGATISRPSAARRDTACTRAEVCVSIGAVSSVSASVISGSIRGGRRLTRRLRGVRELAWLTRVGGLGEEFFAEGGGTYAQRATFRGDPLPQVRIGGGTRGPLHVAALPVAWVPFGELERELLAGLLWPVLTRSGQASLPQRADGLSECVPSVRWPHNRGTKSLAQPERPAANHAGVCDARRLRGGLLGARR